ncbi:putative low molecular weight protein-tyrosine-phosphatase [Nocardioides dokdonensis FR1436]|uniref:protein-tyrosine-phosphatase n=1 Tax=Nocardioides dokdonensis FR1436 TaxID=1300347 RepID=A0A1A9GIQ1_9ACTN|nr:low molecular weight protein-tyrosine-phosphatase [Nocardioides dokdonensis]ANH37503.1 putative low molecular weight protein-tyrosine-phosphatase [Nocardioides dokdonensis FR1436]
MTPDRPGAPTIPAPRVPGRYAVALVCLGNICRSPMADVVLSRQVEEAGLAAQVRVASSGTADWHVGKPMDPRAAAALRAQGYDPSTHRARHFDAGWLEEHDLVLVMDEQNLADVGGRSERVQLFRDHDPVGTGGVVPDPYYGGDEGFEEVLTMVERTSAAVVAAVLDSTEQSATERA